MKTQNSDAKKKEMLGSALRANLRRRKKIVAKKIKPEVKDVQKN